MSTTTQKRRIAIVPVAVFLLACLLAGPLAGLPAAEAQVPTTSPDAKPTPDAAPAPAAQPAAAPMQAGVQMVEVSLEHLRDLGIDLKHVMAGASHLYDEVNIAPVSLQTMPEVVGRGIIINIPIAAVPMGPPAPPRKSRLDTAMAQITPIITQLKTDVDAFLSGQRRLDITDDTRTELRPLFEDWARSVTAMAGQLTSLNSLTAGPKFDNQAISQAAQQIQANCQVLQKDLKKVYKILQKEGKRSRKA